MAWHGLRDKPLSEPMMVNLLTHIYASLGINELRVKIWKNVTLSLLFQIRDVVSDPKIGEMRIQFWKDTLDLVYKVSQI